MAFDHSQLRRFIVAFGSLFNRVTISRKDTADDEVQRMVVPLDYGPKERWLRRLVQDPELTRSVSVIFPRMTFSLSSAVYDGSRKVNTMHKLTFTDPSSNTKFLQQYVGVPYNLTFDLSIGIKYQRDGFQIIEQILPLFTPDLTFAMKPVPDLPDLVDQVPLTLLSVGHSDNYEGDFEHRRAIIWDLSFLMKTNIWSARKSASRIHEVITDLHAPFDLDAADVDDPQLARITVTANPLVQDPDDPDYPTADTTIEEA